MGPHIISTTDTDNIVAQLKDLDVSRIHATNGIYGGSSKLFVPTNLACFQMISEKSGLVNLGDAFVIAVNSNVSLENNNKKLRALGKDVPPIQDQFARARNIAEPIALQFRNHPVIAMFYDEDAPAAADNRDVQQEDGLYDRLARHDFEMVTLSKGGFGTDPRKAPIIGTEVFQKVYAYPFSNDTKHIQNHCADISGEPMPLSDNVEIVRLTEEVGRHGTAYMSENNKVLFPINHPDLRPFKL